MGMSVDIHTYNINDLVEWVKTEQSRFDMPVEDDLELTVKIKKLVEMYTKIDNSTGDFTLLWNEYYEEYNSALNFELDIRRLFGFRDSKTENGEWIFTRSIPYGFGDDGVKPLEDSEWEEIFGFIPKDPDEDIDE